MAHNNLSDKKIVLVTGATGFTGSHLAKRLVDEGFYVKAIVRDVKKAQGLQEIGVELIEGDLKDKELIYRSMEGVRIVFHVAALFRQAGLPDSEYWFVNKQAAMQLAQAALDEGVEKFVHCSTIGVHGDVKNPPCNEEGPLAPGDIYQVTKLEGEKAVYQLYQDKNLPLTVIRPAGIYGPGDLRFLKLFKLIKNKKFIMIGKGKTLWHPIYIDDLVEAFILAGKKGNEGEIFIIGGSEYFPLNELVITIADVLKVKRPQWKIPFGPVYFFAACCEFICKMLKLEPPLHRRRVDFFKKTRAFDVSHATKKLGFKAKVLLKDGIAKTANWYQEQGLL